MVDKKVLQQMLVVGAARAMSATGDKEQIEFFISLDERVGHLQRRGRIHICVHLAQYQQQLPLQLGSVVHIGGRRVLRTERPAHPLLVPPDLVHAIVMTSAVGHSYLVELGMEQQASKRVLSSRRGTRT